MNIRTVLEQVLPGLGYELVDLELTRGGAIRVFMDTPQGVSIDDCSLVHQQLSRLFVVEGIPCERLEVSSPGLDRPLKKKEDYQRFLGHLVRLRTYLPIENQRNFIGRLLSFDQDMVTLECKEKGALCIAFTDIEKARLEPEFQKRKS